MPEIPSVGLLIVVAALLATAAPPRAVAASDASLRARVVELVNEARSKPRRCGRQKYAATRPLSASRPLDEAAVRHARDMIRRKYFDHRAPDGTQPWDRIRRAGYEPRISGENIAYGPETAEEVVAGWLESPGHCANIMDGRFEHIGVGIAKDSRRDRLYWVQTFGAPWGGRR